MKVVCISDTHSRHELIPQIPDGDVLIHAGDCTAFGKMTQLEGFVEWMSALPHSHKILIAGNHDYCLYRKAFEYADILKETGISYLQNSGIEINGTKFWGSPHTPFFRHMAFEKQRDQLAEIWAQIPVNTHVLITHGPPWTVFDKVQDGKHVGCEALLDRLDELPELRAHIFGHIHESYGFAVREKDLVKFANASTCNSRHEPINPPIIVHL